MRTNIRIEIDKIVLDGFNNIDDKYIIASAVEEELYSLISNSELLRDAVTGYRNNNDDTTPFSNLVIDEPPFIQIPDVDAGSFNIFSNSLKSNNSNTISKVIGNQIGRSIFKGLLSSQRKKA